MIIAFIKYLPNLIGDILCLDVLLSVFVFSNVSNTVDSWVLSNTVDKVVEILFKIFIENILYLKPLGAFPLTLSEFAAFF